MSNYGLNLNCSLVRDANGEYCVGIHVADSQNIDIDFSGQGEDIYSLMDEAMNDIVQDYIKQKSQPVEEKKSDSDKLAEAYDYIEKLEGTIEELKDQVQSYSIDNYVLQQRVSDQVNKKEKTLTPTPISELITFLSSR